MSGYGEGANENNNVLTSSGNFHKQKRAGAAIMARGSLKQALLEVFLKAENLRGVHDSDEREERESKQDAKLEISFEEREDLFCGNERTL
jgi:hypothetical protein